MIERALQNYHILKGTYFDDLVEIGDDFVGVRSSTFPDEGWNYIFSKKMRSDLSSSLCELTAKHYQSIIPPLLFTPDQELKVRGNHVVTLGNESAWMSITSPNYQGDDDRFQFKTFEKPRQEVIEDLTEVFRKSYCNKLPDQIGYNDLDDYYVQGFAKMISLGERVVSIAAYMDGDAVGVASVVYAPDRKNWGLYNVGIVPKARRVALGLALSEFAVKTAFDRGAEVCILQTESESEVQALYEKCGFNLDFHMQFASIEV